MSKPRLIDDALAIWRAGVDAVRADRVVAGNVQWTNSRLIVDETTYDLRGIERLVVVGAGKATYGMLVGLAESFARGPHPALRVSGWINVPDGVAEHRRISFGDSGSVEVFPARPQGVNEPTERVVEGSRRIVDLVRGDRLVERRRIGPVLFASAVDFASSENRDHSPFERVRGGYPSPQRGATLLEPSQRWTLGPCLPRVSLGRLDHFGCPRRSFAHHRFGADGARA
jgi:hypothetical protein